MFSANTLKNAVRWSPRVEESGVFVLLDVLSSPTPWRIITPVRATTEPMAKATRHPQSPSCVCVRVLVRRSPKAEPISIPNTEPQSPQMQKKPRCRSGADSARKMIEVVYSPPAEIPWRSRRSTTAIGAAIPIWAWVGKKAIPTVGIAMAITDRVRARRRPTKSPMRP